MLQAKLAQQISASIMIKCLPDRPLNLKGWGGGCHLNNEIISLVIHEDKKVATMVEIILNPRQQMDVN